MTVPVPVPVLALDSERAMLVADERPQGTRLVHEHTTGRLLAAFFAVHRELGHGFAEAVYLRALILELASRGVQAEQDVPLGVFYKGRKIGTYAADLLVDGKVVVAVRAGGELLDADRARLLNCMRCSQAEVGMLLHFGTKPEFRRYLGRVVVEQGSDDARPRATRGAMTT
ncbi:MAG: GxxExxY protein [Gemmatimonadetes bacterium]|nr:GxxExxY protein [Gemmatimonadota bacterium]MBK7835326.1 GxxExxY protein [Gemmatimonadota bacterium]